MEHITFKNITINDWKQFEKVDIHFHPKLTVFTGANGSGKTTILNLLSRHFGWNHLELSTPAKDTKTGLLKFFTRFFKKPTEKTESKIGELVYSNNHKSALTIPDTNTVQYSINIPQQQSFRGINIPSHRPTYSYKEVGQIKTKKRTKQEAYDLSLESSRNFYFGGGGHSSLFHIKETMLGWAIGGSGNEFIEKDEGLIKCYIGFEDILKKILPKNIGFQKLAIRNYEVILVTQSGDFMLDAVSGGVSAIIDIAWQIYTFSNKEDEHMTILIDEVENHLHPNMQRSILSDLLEAFPNIQFIVSTHSPLIVGSVKDSNVYVFRISPNDEGYTKVNTEKLDLIEKAKTATEILNEVLGVPFTMPLWVEHELNNVVNTYSGKEITEKTFDEMRNDLQNLGLEYLMPVAIKKTLKRND